MSVVLRDYQVEARNAVWSGFKSGVKRGLLILPTGAGKTVTCGSVIQPLAKHGKRVLFVVHRKELLSQAQRAFESMGMSCAFEMADDRVDVDALPDVTLASVQTLKGKRLSRFAADSFYLVVIDEGHRGAAASYKSICDHFAAARVLALTATPDRGDGKPLVDVYDKVLYRMEIGDAVRKGILCPIELVDVAVETLNLDQVTTRSGDYAPGELEAEILKDSVLHGMAKPLVEHFEGRKTIAFLPGVASAHRFAEVLVDRGVTAVAVDGGMDDDTRRAAFAKYESGEALVICCADLLTEGYDHPATACIALCSPTKSRSRLIQRIGRGTRNSPGKANLLVMNFTPGTVTKATMEAPADALAGCPFNMREDVGKNYKAKRKEADAKMVADFAAEEAARLEKNSKLVTGVGVEYAITRMPLVEFLQAAGLGTCSGGEASDKQMSLLERMGYAPNDLRAVTSAKQASALIEAANKRRDTGLCTLAQHRVLKRFGYRDTISMAEANHLMNQLRARGYRPIESRQSAERRGTV